MLYLSDIANKNIYFSKLFNIPIFISCQIRVNDLYKENNMNRELHKQTHEIFLIDYNKYILYDFSLYTDIHTKNKFYFYVDCKIELTNEYLNQTEKFIVNVNRMITDNKYILINLDNGFVKYILNKKTEGVKIKIIEDNIELIRYIEMLSEKKNININAGTCLEITKKHIESLLDFFMADTWSGKYYLYFGDDSYTIHELFFNNNNKLSLFKHYCLGRFGYLKYDEFLKFINDNKYFLIYHSELHQQKFFLEVIENIREKRFQWELITYKQVNAIDEINNQNWNEDYIHETLENNFNIKIGFDSSVYENNEIRLKHAIISINENWNSIINLSFYLNKIKREIKSK